jgi:hypothetical protein
VNATLLKPKSEVNRKIVRELQQALEYLGADSSLADLSPVDLYQKLQELGAGREILAAVGSWGDTLDDEEVRPFERLECCRTQRSKLAAVGNV